MGGNLKRQFGRHVRFCVGGLVMMRSTCSGLALAAVLMLPGLAQAAETPAVKTSETNRVTQCATPGRLMAFVKAKNDNLDPRFEKIAVDYMRHGEQLGLRWDYTFYQMLLETGFLSFRGDHGRHGDVKPSQNNFAGLGAIGGGAHGESFPDVSTGVLAHLQHVLVYAGEVVDNPVAERTRKVQEWGILKSMQKRAKGTVTFGLLATKWAPGSDYVAGLEAIRGRFEDSGFCKGSDPHPEWVQEARGGTAKAVPVASAAPAEADQSEKITGAELARRAIAQGKEESDNQRKGLGGAAIAAGPAAKPAATTPSYSVLNAPRGEPQAIETTTEAEPEAAPEKPEAKSAAMKPEKPAPKADRPMFAIASAAGGLAKSIPKTAPDAKPQAAEKAEPGKCHVFTASYGGQKSLIIRVKSEAGIDFTVLDVNEGSEKREADAYISAYAKGGVVDGEFANQEQALEKAFELCPEG
ncbi:MAG: glucosaminidase domain-containing protein [Proteobacteria bacterium]|nr:glucosaminidase domain-containing protein [Pseudomonadota bacterium]